jgi:acyl carrier protein
MEDKEMTFDKVKELMISTLSCDEGKIKPEATIADDLGIDSLDAVELVMALEEEYGIKIPDEELGNMETVGDIVNCVEKYKAQ